MNRIAIATSLLISLQSCADNTGEAWLSKADTDRFAESDALKEVRSRQHLEYWFPGEEEPRSEDLFGPDPLQGQPGYPSLWQMTWSECIAVDSDVGAITWFDEDVCGDTAYDCSAHAVRGDCGCEEMVCEVRQFVCRANLLLDIADANDVTQLRWSDAGSPVVVEIPPQDRATRAALKERVAQLLAGEIPSRADLAENHMATTTCEDEYQGTEPNELTNGGALISFFGEMYELADESVRGAVEDYIALADAQMSRRVDVADGAVAMRELRLHAATLLAGGDASHPDTVLATLCTQPQLGPSQAEALRLIRYAGMPPGVVQDSAVSINDFLSSTLQPSLKDRLAHLWRQEALIDPMSQAEFLDSLGLEVDDFEHARAHLQQELTVFARSPDAQAGEVPNETNDSVVYSGTFHAPTAPSWVHYAALSSRLDAVGVDPGGTPYASREERRRQRGVLAQSIADSVASAGALLSHASPSVAAAAERLLLRLAPEWGGDSHRAWAGTDYLVDLYSPGSGFLSAPPVLVTDTDALACALSGSIEGSACSWATDVAPHIQSVSSVDFEFIAWQWAASENTPFYILRQKAGSPADTPGSYESMLGGVVQPAGSTETDMVPVVSELSRWAGELMTPSPRWCVRPEKECGFFHGRLPLEDELTDDGDAFESSWRRYLQLARQAADEADDLGEEALDSRLDVELRAEEAASDLEDLCGVGVSISPLTEAIANNPSQSPSDLLAALLLTNPELRPLSECLNEGSTMRYVAMGSRELCAWHRVGDESTLCAFDGPGEPGLDCPRLPTQVDASGCQPPSGSYQGVRIADSGQDGLLGLFNPPTSLGAVEQASPTLCAHVRQLHQASADSDRAGFVAAWEAIQALNEAGALSYDSLRRVAPKVRWEAEPGSYSAIYVGDKLLGSTGSLLGGDATTGICTNPGPPMANCDCPPAAPTCDQSSTLLCAGHSCTDEAERARLNSRMAAASIMARWLGGSSLAGFVVPEHIPAGEGPAPSGSLYPIDGVLPGTTNAYFSYTGEDRRSATHYCIVPATPTGASLWRFARDEQLITPFDSATAPAPGFPTECPQLRFSGSSVRFHELGGEQPFGGPVYDPLVGARHRLAAQRFLQALHEPVDSHLNSLQGMGGGASVHFHVGCRDGSCPQLQEFPWVHAVSGESSPEQQIAGSGARFFLDVRGPLVPQRVMFDALELLCAASEDMSERLSVNITTVTTRASLNVAAGQLNDAAGAVRTSGATLVLRDLPRSVYDGFDAGALDHTADTRGAIGASTLRIGSALEDFAAIPAQLADELDALERDTRAVDLALRRASNGEELVDIELQREVANQISTCAVAVLNAAAATVASAGDPRGAVAGGLRIAAAAVTCINSMVQIGYAVDRRDTLLDNIEVDRQEAFLNFERTAAARASAMETLDRRMRASVREIQAGLEELRGLRSRASRLLNRALFLEQDETGAIMRTNTYLRRRLSTRNERYQRARRNAIEMAWLAKRAIEQRFGVELSGLDEDMSLVAAPATWESTVCTLDGLDFDRIVAEGGDGPASIADEYIGEYVTRLEQFVESYRLDFPFQNAQDTMVVSLRDDVANVRASCPTQSSNLLYHAGALQAEAGPSSFGWSMDGCYISPTSGAVLPSCMAIEALQGESPPTTALGDTGTPSAFRVTFGPAPPASLCNPITDPNCPCEGRPECGYEVTANWGQDRFLRRGTYRLSWFGKRIQGGSITPRNVVKVVGLDSGTDYTAAPAEIGSGIPPVEPLANPPSIDEYQWARYWYTFSVDVPEAVRLAIRWDSVVTDEAVDLAGFMLEDLGAFTSVSSAVPSVWIETDDRLEHPLPVCEDTNGEVFRGEAWTRNCVRLCDDGFGRDCSPERGTDHCYWETVFHLSQRAIDRGQVLNHAGFARGNFNYRIDRLGVNFVGTNLRDCSESTLPTTCYSGGFVPYSLRHIGPYTVRNHIGDTYSAPLFTGHIEHARGLAAERYLTNPLSSADRALVDPYMQSQFRGRPLAGSYRLRVWEEDGVNFDAIEDVQVVLDYRFWTRFE